MKKFGNVLWGVVLIVIGLIIGGNALGITSVNIFFDGWWTLLIIIPSFIGLFKDNEKTGNLIGLLIGIALFLACQDILDFSKINAGIGNLELNIQGDKENYTIKADKGIGSIKIDGKEVADDVTYGSGENTIKIDGGIGSINVDFED